MAICVTMVRRSWMAAGSVEATLELWASSLRTVKERIRPVFRQDRTAAAAGLFLDALLGPERRKPGWMRAEAAGDPGPWRPQALADRMFVAEAEAARPALCGERGLCRMGRRRASRTGDEPCSRIAQSLSVSIHPR